MVFLLLTVKVVQAIELGGFDVDMGTGSFENDSSWDQEESTGGTTSSDNDNYDSNNNWSNTDDSWNTGDDSSGAGAGSYTTGNTNTVQPETDWNDFFSADSYEDGTSNNTASQNNSSEIAGAADQRNSNDTLQEIENTEQQISDTSPTPIPSSTPTMTPTPSISPTPTPASEIQKNILTVPQKEEELTEEECRQKMQLIYCRKEIRNAAEAEIIPDRSLVIAVISIRINGKEADWHWRGSRILLKLNPQEMQTEVETAVMCRKELSWTEAKKNAILTYNIF